MKQKLQKNLRLLLSALCFIMATSAFAQVTVTGTVTDDSGETMPGVSVRLKGNPSVAAATNIDGRFSLSVPNLNQTLQVSFIGYESRDVALNGKNDVNITLHEDSKVLDEVVVVGYGQQKKISVTGSISAVSGNDLVKAPMQNVSNLLTGKVSGITAVQSSGRPGDDGASIHVRGLNDFAGSGPLVVIDGVPGDMNMVNPNDIENISVLKDASAAIYGVRAANGVILITTKKGNDAPAKISYSGNVAFARNTALPRFLNAQEYMYYHNKASVMDGIDPLFDADIQRRVLAADPDDFLGETDWFKETYRTGITQQHTLSATGGSNRMNYFVSLGIMDQKGTMRKTDYTRYNFRSNLDITVAKNMRFLANISGYRTERDWPNCYINDNQSEFNPAVQTVRMLPIFQKEYKGYPVAYGTGGVNPIATLDNSGWTRNQNNNIQTNFQLEYDFKDVHPILDGLKASFWGSYQYVHSTSDGYFGSIMQYQVSTKDFKPTLTYKAGYGQGDEISGTFSKSSSNSSQWIIRPQVSYNHKFGKATIGLLYLYEATKSSWSGLGASARKFITNDPIDINLGFEIIPTAVTGSHNYSSIVSHVGRFNFDWDDKYFAEFAFRSDGSYKFAPQNRWGFFPSASVGWVMSSENFIKDNIEWIDFLKLRASYGESGKDNIGDFLYKSLFNTRKDGFIFPSGATIPLAWTDSYVATNLRWSHTRSYNVGFEVDVLRRKLGLEFDVYYQYTDDLLESVSGTFPGSLGGNAPKSENSGAVDNRGFDFTVKHELAVNKDFSYRLRGTFSFARNKVLRKKINDDHPSWRNVLGYPMGARFGLIATGLAQTQEQIDNAPAAPSGEIRLGDILYVDTNGDGKISYKGTESDYVRIGYGALPEITFSMNMDFNYKNFYLNMLWQGVTHVDYTLNGAYGNGHTDATNFTRPFYAEGNSPAYLVEDAWTPENTGARYPRLSTIVNGNNNVASTWWLVNGEYLRLKNLTFGYEIPEKVLKHTPFSRFNVYVAGTNVLTLSHFKWLDPESPSISNGFYPQQATWSLGVNLSF